MVEATCVGGDGMKALRFGACSIGILLRMTKTCTFGGGKGGGRSILVKGHLFGLGIGSREETRSNADTIAFGVTGDSSTLEAK